ncbi:MAG: right-handed parallel beta-helix repeat-containing protein, partial [Actinobacteria bacterium]|nr:right-handed parallel beta-helix repeat-containing protein [Actinomycetota bacterium]
LLASGSYGTFTGAMKSGPVTIRPRSGATATMALRLSPASNLTFDGLKITDAFVADPRSRNITVRNSDFDGARVMLRGDDLVDANIDFDNNVHSDVNVCDGCSDARVHIAERNEARPNGITIRNSRFYGGSADGILNGGNGTRIIGNTFSDLFQTGADGAHTDSIQLYGSKNTLVKANFFYNVDMGNPGAYDQADHEVIEDNVIVSARYPFQMQLLSDNGSIVRHNTFVATSTRGGGCDYNLPCGIVRMGNKSSDPRSTGTVFENNILAEISVTGQTPAYAVEDYNLFSEHKAGGRNDELGVPLFVGGARPTTYEGFRLAAGSPGKGTASDGLDRGARIGETSARFVQPPPPPRPAAAVTVRMLSKLRQVLRTGKIRLSLRTTVAGPLSVTADIRPGRAQRSGRRRASTVIRVTRRSFGRTHAGTRRVALVLSRSARRRLARSRDARLIARVSVGTARKTAKLTIRR